MSIVPFRSLNEKELIIQTQRTLRLCGEISDLLRLFFLHRKCVLRSRECPVFHLRLILYEGLGDLRCKVDVLLDEFGGESLIKTDHIMIDQDLAIAVLSSSYADSGDP